MAKSVATDVLFDVRQWDSAVRLLSQFPEESKPLVADALNRGANKAGRAVKRVASDELGVSQKEFEDYTKTRSHPRGGVRIIKATRKSLAAFATVSAARIPVYRWFTGERPGKRITFRRPRTKSRLLRDIYKKLQSERGGDVTWKQRTRTGGVRWRIKGRQSVFERRAFVMRLKSGHVGVFRALGKKRFPKKGTRKRKSPEFPLKELRGPSLVYVAEQSAPLGQALATDVSTVVRDRLDYQLGRLLKGQGTVQDSGGNE